MAGILVLLCGWSFRHIYEICCIFILERKKMSIPKILNFPCSRDEPLKSVHFHHRFTHCWHSQTDLSPLPSLQVLSGRQSLHHHISSTSFYYAPSICLAPKPGNIKGCSKRPENYFVFFSTFWLWGVFVATHGLSLAVARRCYPLAVRRGFLIAVASLVVEHRL